MQVLSGQWVAPGSFPREASDDGLSDQLDVSVAALVDDSDLVSALLLDPELDDV